MYTFLCIYLYKVLKWLLSLNEMRLANNPAPPPCPAPSPCLHLELLAPD